MQCTTFTIFEAESKGREFGFQDLASRSADEEQVAKLKKDLKRTKVLLKDAQLMADRSRGDSSSKVVLRQLKNQLEDAEFGRTAAIKAKQNAEMELADVQAQLDDVLRNKGEVEDRLLRVGREKADIAGHLEDNEEELADVMKKYKAAVAQLSVDQITIHEQANNITDLEEERNSLKEQLAEYAQKIQSLDGDNVSSAQHHRLELKIRELESKLDLEQTTRGRMETQINRLKEGVEKLNGDCDVARQRENTAQEEVHTLQYLQVRTELIDICYYFSFGSCSGSCVTLRRNTRTFSRGKRRRTPRRTNSRSRSRSPRPKRRRSRTT